MSERKQGINFFRKHHMGDWAAMTRRKGCSFADEGVLLNAIDLYWKRGCEGFSKFGILVKYIDNLMRPI